MAAIFNKQKASCGCNAPVSSPDGEDFSPTNNQLRPLGVGCCYSVDLDVVYNEMVVYTEANTPCLPCLNRAAIEISCVDDEEGNCVSCTASYIPPLVPYPYGDDSDAPHGRVSDWEVPQCSKLVILKGVIASDTSLTYESVSIFKSRKRGTNPTFFRNTTTSPSLVCANAPKCDPVAIRKCCRGRLSYQLPAGSVRAYFEYRGCTVASDVGEAVPSYANCVTCTEDPEITTWFSNLVLPCYMDFEAGSISSREYMMAYRPEASWWFVDEELPSMYAELAQNDPYKGRKHNIAIHFEVNSKSISCCRRSCPDRVEVGSVPCGSGGDVCTYTQNDLSPGFCGGVDPFGNGYHLRYLTDQNARERATKIYAVAGYFTGCGSDDLDELCNRNFVEP